MNATTAHDIHWLLNKLRRLDAEPAARRWDAFGPDDWPALFRLLDLGADLPRFAGQRALAEFPGELWPDLKIAFDDLIRVQEMVDHPTVPGAAMSAPSHDAGHLDAAARELEERHCVHVDFLFDAERRPELESLVRRADAARDERWGQLERDDAPELFALVDRAVAGDAFRRLTGFDPGRDEYTLTLAIQDLQPAGIGWHRDLYWPREWVGQDVFPVLYALGSDSPEKGGAFLYYVPWENRIYAHYRHQHPATVMWNSARSDGRLLHAVSGYHGEDTSRHLMILQCLRRNEET